MRATSVLCNRTLLCGIGEKDKHIMKLFLYRALARCRWGEDKDCCYWGDFMNCDECVFYAYDDEAEDYFCSVDMDEDDYARLVSDSRESCPYYRADNEYEIVRHQM